mmetsp:Transcript_15051/g.23125  ORF Transcript_15051/g.23125 Transcript_15051/m.23125 type:complete len:253 (+) Transcript_15051:1175-1933(+)
MIAQKLVMIKIIQKYPKKMMRRKSHESSSTSEEKTTFFDRATLIPQMMRRKSNEARTAVQTDPLSHPIKGAEQKLVSIKEDRPTQRASSDGQFKGLQQKMLPIEEGQLSGRSTERPASEGHFELDTDGWAQKEAAQETSEASIDPKPWWTKMNVKKPFGQMQIAAMKTPDMNSSLRDINLDQSERRFASEDLYDSANFDSFCTYGGRDLSEYSAASVSNNGLRDSSSNLQDRSKLNYSDFCDRMAKRKGLHS